MKKIIYLIGVYNLCLFISEILDAVNEIGGLVYKYTKKELRNGRVPTKEGAKEYIHGPEPKFKPMNKIGF